MVSITGCRASAAREAIASTREKGEYSRVQRLLGHPAISWGG
jgi:hypothetical protein